MKKILFAFFLSFSIILSGCNFGFSSLINKGDGEVLVDYSGKIEERVIAHAMGSLGEKAYLNCYECFEYYYERGTKFFEIDFAYSTDNKLIATHFFENIGGSNMTYERYKNYKIAGNYRGITMEDFITMVVDHKDAYFIIDTKNEDKAGLLQDIVSAFIESGNESSIKRIIPYLYKIIQYVEFEKVYPFREYIFTAYQNIFSGFAEDTQEEIIDFLSKNAKIKYVVANYDFQGITGYGQTYFNRVVEAGKKLYLFTVDDKDGFVNATKNMKAIGVVTNTISVSRLSGWNLQY